MSKHASRPKVDLQLEEVVYVICVSKLLDI